MKADEQLVRLLFASSLRFLFLYSLLMVSPLRQINSIKGKDEVADRENDNLNFIHPKGNPITVRFSPVSSAYFPQLAHLTALSALFANR